jgi:hypothetical protein
METSEGEEVWKRSNISKEEFFKPVSYKGTELTLSEYMLVKFCEDKADKARKLKADQEAERNLLLRSVSLVTALSSSSSSMVRYFWVPLRNFAITDTWNVLGNEKYP